MVSHEYYQQGNPLYPYSKIRIREKVSRHKNLLTAYKPDEIE